MKNKLLTFLLVVGIFGLLVGCSKISQNINSEYTIKVNSENNEYTLKTDKGNDFLKVSSVKPVLEDKEELKFAQNIIDEFYAEEDEYYNGDYKDICLSNLEFMGDVIFEANRTYTTYKSVKGIVSLVLEESEYSGGAHGSNTFYALNFDIDNQKILEFKDLFNEGYEEKIKNIVSKKIEELIDGEGIAVFQDYESYFDKNLTDNNFYLDDDSLVIIYNEYDIAPYSEGEIIIKVKFNEIKDILSNRFKES